MPTAVKFHYLFNLRDLSNVFQGLLFSTNECINTPTDIVRLWAHETQRVYLDKLADGKDIDVFEKMQKDYMKKSFDDIPESEAMRKPLIYCHFAKYVIYINKWMQLLYFSQYSNMKIKIKIFI